MRKHTFVLFFVWLIVIISFITTQLTNDFFVFWAYGRSVTNSTETGFGSLIDVWELKGLLFRAYIYAEYIVTAVFFPHFDIYGQIVYKSVGLVPYLMILALSTYLLPGKYVGGIIKKKDCFFISSILLLAVHFASHFQPEMWGVLLLIFSFTLYLHEGRTVKILSGIIFSLTFYLKSPIPLLGGSLVFAAMILKRQNMKKMIKDVVPFAITTVLFLSITLCLLLRYYPQEMDDIWNASYYQHTLFHSYRNIFSSCLSLFREGIKTILYNPISLVGIVSFILLETKWFRDKTLLNALGLIMVWLFPLIYIIISNCFFVYHYYLLAFSAILSLLILHNNRLEIKRSIIVPSFMFFVVYYMLTLSSVSPTNLYEREKYADCQKNLLEKEGIHVGCTLGEGEIMYLDAGMGAFFFENRSYLRYFYPLPLQRTKSTDEFVNMQTYKTIKKQALSYKGEYITLDKKWFLKNGNNNDVYEKITKEYNLYKQLVYSSYSWELFANTSAIDTLLVYRKR